MKSVRFQVRTTTKIAESSNSPGSATLAQSHIVAARRWPYKFSRVNSYIQTTMYHNRPWEASSASESTSTNNPFLESSASNRFPALDTSQSLGSPSVYPSQTYNSPLSQYPQSSYSTQQIQPQYTSWNGQPQPQSPLFNQGGFQGYAVPQQQYQSAGYGPYGQQYGQQAYVGQLQPQPQPQVQYTGYMQTQQQPVPPQQYQQSVISQFDPYAASGGSGGNTNGWSGQNQNHGGSVSPIQTQRSGPSGQPHPRQFIQSHKVELESWNAGTWKQAISLFNELKRSWEKRRVELQKHLVGGQYLTAEDIESLNAACFLIIYASLSLTLFFSCR